MEKSIGRLDNTEQHETWESYNIKTLFSIGHSFELWDPHLVYFLSLEGTKTYSKIHDTFSWITKLKNKN
jgi:hypothetical protein